MNNKSTNDEIAIWEWNYQTHKVKVSTSFNRILKLRNQSNEISEKRLITQLQRLLTEEQYLSLMVYLQRCREENETFTLSFLITFRVKDKKWIKLTAHPIERDRTWCIQGIIQNITIQRKQQEERELHRFLVDNAPNLFFLVQKNGAIKYANQKAIKALGYPKDQLLRSSIIDLNIKYSKIIWQQVREHIFLNPNYEEETILQKQDKTILPVRLRAKQIHPSRGIYIALYGEDISREKIDKRQLEQLEQKLKTYESVETKISLPATSKKIKKLFPKIITQTPAYLKLLEKIYKGATTETTILILGETGTGKELIADAIHHLSNRQNQPFVKVNCAALPDNLIESELFGYEKGAFTGADNQKVGRFELANGGSLFLDEIGELPYLVQSKLLRVLEDGTFERIGGVSTVKVNVRIIAATNQNLLALVEQGKFRQDLYYRLNIFPVFNPPLRKRRQDIPLLAKFFLKEFIEKYQKPKLQITKAQIALLMQNAYTGNIRELRAIIQRAVILSSNTQLDLKGSLENPLNESLQLATFPTFEEIQRTHILKALEKTNWRVSGSRGAAKLLDLNPNTLETKMRKLNIRRPK